MAKGTSARLFPYAAMNLDMDGEFSPEELQRRSWTWASPPSLARIDFLTGTSDLPILCAMMTRDTYDLQSPTLNIRMGERFHGKGGPEVAKNYFKTLLPCLKHVRGFVEVNIQGLPDHPLLVDTTVVSMCSGWRSAAEIMNSVSDAIYRATTALDEGKHQLAITGYKIALSILRGSCFTDSESSQVLVHGRYDGLPAGL